MVLDELADNLGLAKHLCDGQYQVGRGHSSAQAAGHMHAGDVGCQEVHGLAEHSGFGFDAADAPADDA